MDARLVGNIALVDQHHNFVSFVTIFHWMFTAKKDRFLNIFPIPGVSDADILSTKNYGTSAISYLEKATGKVCRKKWCNKALCR